MVVQELLDGLDRGNRVVELAAHEGQLDAGGVLQREDGGRSLREPRGQVSRAEGEEGVDGVEGPWGHGDLRVDARPAVTVGDGDDCSRRGNEMAVLVLASMSSVAFMVPR